MTKLKYSIIYSSRFKRQFRLIKKRGYNIQKIEFVIRELAMGNQLELKYDDHKLQNNKKYKNFRECHIDPDWLLVYQIKEDALELYLFETGTHSDLFDL